MVEEYYSYNFVKSLRLVLDCWIPSTVGRTNGPPEMAHPPQNLTRNQNWAFRLWNLSFLLTLKARICIFQKSKLLATITGPDLLGVWNGPSTNKSVWKWFSVIEEYYSYNFVKSLRLVLDCWIPSTVRCPGHHCPRYIHQFRLLRRKVPKCGYQGLPNPYVKPFGARLLIKCTSEPGLRQTVSKFSWPFRAFSSKQVFSSSFPRREGIVASHVFFRIFILPFSHL